MPAAKRVFLVTGASGNVGHLVVSRLLAAGAQVAGVDRHPPAEFGRGASYFGWRADLTVEAEVAAAFAAAEQKLGAVWGVVHTAGSWQGGQPVRETVLELFEAMLSVNLRTSFLVGREALRCMVPREGGRIALVGAYSAATFTHLSGSGAYAVSKAGVAALAKVLADEGRPHGVFTNCVAPNTLATPANRASMPKADASRWVPVEAVAEALVGVVMPECGLNGSVLTLSGK